MARRGRRRVGLIMERRYCLLHPNGMLEPVQRGTFDRHRGQGPNLIHVSTIGSGQELSVPSLDPIDGEYNPGAPWVCRADFGTRITVTNTGGPVGTGRIRRRLAELPESGEVNRRLWGQVTASFPGLNLARSLHLVNSALSDRGKKCPVCGSECGQC